MRRRKTVSLLVFLLVLLPMGVSAQLKIAVDDAQKHKLSMTTEMFINELNDGGFDPVKQAERHQARRASLGNIALKELKDRGHGKNAGRLYVAPDTINGRAYVSAFITLEDNNDVSALEALGVKVQCKFDKGIITSEIPVDKIVEVAALNYVKKISVARLMEPSTDIARKRTNVDDVLTLSTNAFNAGLDMKYDGTGVLLGIIDTGIDFQHIAFKDKDGNSRIVGGYIYDGKEHNYNSENIIGAETDDSSQDHGTHTASTAGGSSVIIDGNNVTVTDNHANATYGGMAPGTSLFLCGVKDLIETYLCNSFQKICKYADDHKMPVVISNSWNSNIGPHDGTKVDNNEFKTVLSTRFGENSLNSICLFSSSNEADISKDNEGGDCPKTLI